MANLSLSPAALAVGVQERYRAIHGHRVVELIFEDIKIEEAV